MPITDILPWKRENERSLGLQRRDDPFLSLQDEMNRLFDNFFSDTLTGRPSRNLSMYQGGFMPRVDMSENDKEVLVSAEIPGMDENDIQVTFSNGVLSIYGEKRDEKEEKTRRYHRIERSFGSFRREVEVPCEVEEDQITATFKKGVLTVALPKSTRPEVTGKHIPVLKG